MKNIAILMSALLLLNAADGLAGYPETTEANRGICEEMAAKIGVPADKLDSYMAACVDGAKGRRGHASAASLHGGKTKRGKAAKGAHKKGSKRAARLAEAKLDKSGKNAHDSKKTKKSEALGKAGKRHDKTATQTAKAHSKAHEKSRDKKGGKSAVKSERKHPRKR